MRDIELEFYIRDHRVLRFADGEVRIECGPSGQKILLGDRPRYCPECDTRLNDSISRMGAGSSKSIEALRFMRRSEQRKT